MANPVEELDDQLSKVDFVFVVCKLFAPAANPFLFESMLTLIRKVYRGSWCPFCIAYLKDLQSLTGAIDAANGTTIIVTAEQASKLETTRAASGYTGSAIVDTKNMLATELRRRGLVDVAISKKSGYPQGMAQPAVLVLKKDGTVMYSWAIVPGMVRHSCRCWLIGKN